MLVKIKKELARLGFKQVSAFTFRHRRIKGKVFSFDDINSFDDLVHRIYLLGHRSGFCEGHDEGRRALASRVHDSILEL